MGPQDAPIIVREIHDAVGGDHDFHRVRIARAGLDPKRGFDFLIDAGQRSHACATSATRRRVTLIAFGGAIGRPLEGVRALTSACSR